MGKLYLYIYIYIYIYISGCLLRSRRVGFAAAYRHQSESNISNDVYRTATDCRGASRTFDIDSAQQTAPKQCDVGLQQHQQPTRCHSNTHATPHLCRPTHRAATHVCWQRARSFGADDFAHIYAYAYCKRFDTFRR